VGLATATQAKADPSLRPGDPIGQSGLQAASDAVLRGKPSGELTLVDSAGHTVATLARWAGRDPVAVSSTPRSRMLVAGAELFRDRGFDGTGFREIVNRAGAAVRRLIGIAERIMFEPDLRPGYPVAAVTLAADDPDGQLRTTAAHIFDRWRAAVADCLVRADLAPENAQRFATLAVASVEGSLLLCRAQESPQPLRDVGLALQEHLNGILPT
jgi:TetR/AcrR family transcriptional repressor of lmrAB and yxaGH operons